MHVRTWPVLALAFGTLIALIALSGLSALGRAERIFGEISSLHDRYQRSERILNDLRADIQHSGVLARDFLLDRSNLTASSYRDQLLVLRTSLPRRLETLSNDMGSENAEQFERLHQELDRYWDSLDPIFTWTPEQKLALSTIFLRRQVLPRRDAVLLMMREIRGLNQANLDRQRRQVLYKERELPIYVRRMLAATLLLGLAVTAGSIYSITRLERKSEAQRLRAQNAEEELRRLSQQLVKAHEEERRALSRELHDEIGQMLTAQRMEVRNLGQLRTAPEAEFQAKVEETARLSEETLHAVRDLAMGLRPAMLDDLGLAPALQWQARDFSRRYGVPVTVLLDGALRLPDSHRTCAYRVVQEALTNCARHAKATAIGVDLHADFGRLSITVQDDGVGFDLAKRGRGLGLIGMEERVRELGGKFSVTSQPGKGTALHAEIPLSQQEAASA